MTPNNSITLCAACLLPPRQTKNGESIPLLRCSRCRKVWYHDADCQRKHYKEHRRACHVHSDNSTKISSSKPNKEGGPSEQQQFMIENRPGKGRCMIAVRTIAKAKIIHPPSNSEISSNSGCFQPLVPPVLTQSMRSSRCAVCFGKLKQEFLFQQNPHHPKYKILLCSPKCRELGMPWLAEEERLMFYILSQDNKEASFQQATIHYVFSSAIFAYRICLAMTRDPAVRAMVESLQKNDSDKSLSDLANDARAHALASILIVKRLLLETLSLRESEHPYERLHAVDVEVIWDIICRTKVNAFSICDGEFTTLGLGIYPIASNMNHSCRPNALQTFLFGTNNLPRLRVTTCSEVNPQEEICISYIDNQAPRHLRQNNLNSYGFHCTCPYCTDEDREARLVGLKCQTCGGMGRLDPGTTSTWRCESCQAVTSEMAWKAVKHFSVSYDHNVPLQLLRQFHDTFREYCIPTSWYFQQSAESIVILQLESMQECQDVSEKMKFAHSCLLILDEVLENRVDDDSSILVSNVLHFKAAKLRLFLGSDIVRGMQEMKAVYETLLLYYPSEHEIMEEVRNTVTGTG